MKKTAWLFPGQGSQAIGMVQDLETLPNAQPVFEQAAEILGWSVLQACQEEEKLSQTLYTQPCLYVVESLLATEIQNRGYEPVIVAGHSLGEYVALQVAGVFDFETGLRLVRQRAELMQQASGGQMAALIGFDRDALDQQIQTIDNVVLANDNSSAQVVISGTPEAIDTVLANVKTKRAVKLNVSGAFHSPMMADAAAQFEQILAQVPFTEARFPILSNVEPTGTTDAAVLKQRLIQQMTGSVRWRETCLELANQGVEQVVEVGPGKVLTGLVKRTCSGIELANISQVAQIAEVFPTLAVSG
ncbi:MAG: ACP S-malonyltransferase [Microcoleaceae cyanobacterium]